MRRPAPSLAIHLVLGSFFLLGCTPEPIGRGLWTARAPDAPATSGNWQKNRDAIALAQRGDYDRALAALPTADDVKDDPSVVQDESRTLEVRTLVEENRETLAYWRLRKAFAGAGVAFLARRIVAPGTAYADLDYRQALALSVAYQGGIVAWVAFWAFYGGGFGAENLASVGSFAVAYMAVVLVEPLVDLAVLAGAKTLAAGRGDLFLQRRLRHAA